MKELLREGEAAKRSRCEEAKPLMTTPFLVGSIMPTISTLANILDRSMSG